MPSLSKSLASLVFAMGIASNATLAISVPFVKSTKTASTGYEIQFQNSRNIAYITTISILGQDFEVRLIKLNTLILTKTKFYAYLGPDRHRKLGPLA